MVSVNWDTRWLALADHVSSWSKDQSRQIAAVIVGDRKEVLSIGYNGFPRGVEDEVPERHERPIKYLFTEHAERNAIYNAAARGVKLEGSTMYLSWHPCCDCARAVVQSGITRLICVEPDWGEDKYHFQQAAEILNEGGVEVSYAEYQDNYSGKEK